MQIRGLLLLLPALWALSLRDSAAVTGKVARRGSPLWPKRRKKPSAPLHRQAGKAGVDADAEVEEGV